MSVSEIIKIQAHNQFSQKIKQVIEKAVKKATDKNNNLNFQEVLSIYIH